MFGELLGLVWRNLGSPKVTQAFTLAELRPVVAPDGRLCAGRRKSPGLRMPQDHLDEAHDVRDVQAKTLAGHQVTWADAPRPAGPARVFGGK